jgi:hypothetical protein
MRVLELFKGTGSISRYFNQTDGAAAADGKTEVISLDILPRFGATICCDIMLWDYKSYPRGYFDIIWASPECKVFSALNSTNVGPTRKYKTKADLIQVQKENSKYILRTIEIIEYFNPTNYFIENPLHSKIWEYIPDSYKPTENSVVVDYCYFGYPYKKPTRILTNKVLENRRCACTRHQYQIGITTRNKLLPGQAPDKTTTIQRYEVPKDLIEYLLA